MPQSSPSWLSLSANTAVATAAVVSLTSAVVSVRVASWWWTRRRQQDNTSKGGGGSVLPPSSILEFREEAKRRASPLAKIYIDYADGQGLTEKSARRFLESIRLLPRILTGDVKAVDTSVTGPGQATLSLPVTIAPTAFHDLCCPEGEMATAKACVRAGAGYAYNWMLSSQPYQDVIDHSNNDPIKSEKKNGGGTKWLQMYMFEETDMVVNSIRLAEATGAFSAIVLTCDHPHVRVQNRMVPNFVHYYFRDHSNEKSNANNEKQSDDYMFPNQVAAGGSIITKQQLASGKPIDGTTGTNSYTLSWDSVKWIQSMTKLPIIVKGVLSPHDARMAATLGVAGIIVSNHGGRQMDGAVAAIEMLPSIVQTLRQNENDIQIWVDSGIRTSTDIVKALCLGATGVLLGRPALWALSCGGEDSLVRMLQHLQDDLANDLRSLGVTSLKDLNQSLLYPPDRVRIEHDVALVLKDEQFC